MIICHILVDKDSGGWEVRWIRQDAEFGDIRPRKDLGQTYELGADQRFALSDSDGIMKHRVLGVHVESVFLGTAGIQLPQWI